MRKDLSIERKTPTTTQRLEIIIVKRLQNMRISHLNAHHARRLRKREYLRVFVDPARNNRHLLDCFVGRSRLIARLHEIENVFIDGRRLSEHVERRRWQLEAQSEALQLAGVQVDERRQEWFARAKDKNIVDDGVPMRLRNAPKGAHCSLRPSITKSWVPMRRSRIRRV